MIGRLRGVLASHRDGVITLETGGIGYEVQVTPRDLVALPGVGEEIVVHTHTHVREDEISLYGFVSDGDRDLFRVLIGASGVGPKLAMAMLSAMSSGEILRAITSEDADALTVAPGVGKRGAQKIVLELAPKLSGREINLTGTTSMIGVRQALEGLGYTTGEINAVVGDLNPDDPLQDQIRSALQTLGGR